MLLLALVSCDSFLAARRITYVPVAASLGRADLSLRETVTGMQFAGSDLQLAVTIAELPSRPGHLQLRVVRFAPPHSRFRFDATQLIAGAAVLRTLPLVVSKQAQPHPTYHSPPLADPAAASLVVESQVTLDGVSQLLRITFRRQRPATPFSFAVR